MILGSDKFTVVGLNAIAPESMKCYFVNLVEFQYSEENPIKSCERYVDAVAITLEQLNLKPNKTYTEDEILEQTKEKLIVVNVAVDGALLAKMDKDNACPAIDTYINNTIQTSPFREPAEHDRQHQKQLSFADAMKGTIIEWEKEITQKVAVSLKQPKMFNWGLNLNTNYYLTDRSCYPDSNPLPAVKQQLPR